MIKTNWKGLINKIRKKRGQKGVDKLLENPEKYLFLSSDNYSPDYLRQLKNKLIKKYGNDKNKQFNP